MPVRDVTPVGGSEHGQQRLPLVEVPSGVAREVTSPASEVGAPQNLERVIGGA